ncbi:Transmembrane domain-containing protein [Spironucleus salmonicida]|uniref:Transmembrane domain-containing protein n=1 Tax=Spironucleus salmonicida TaxID=348837 RepID=V6M7U4_9EUKA|nr:Transmembrane domain-containing protein [Spironucleus salmonicida]KAH0577357.1 Transmembrane domain-containing protein [Spironucleus salmonicida]|eukprot:EST49549.1 Transmembrane domain-containing protein [Spironucleus salmonicida]
MAFNGLTLRDQALGLTVIFSTTALLAAFLAYQLLNFWVKRQFDAALAALRLPGYPNPAGGAAATAGLCSNLGVLAALAFLALSSLAVYL